MLIIGLTLELRDFIAEPHVWRKIRMLAAGTPVRPNDIFGLLLLAKLGHIA